jgi:type 1 glutamine amidotransferase
MVMAVGLLLVANNEARSDDAADKEGVQKILDATTDKQRSVSKKRIVTFMWSKNDHAKGTHSYRAFAEKWKGLLDKVDNVSCELVNGFPKSEQWDKTDLMVVYLTQKFLSDEQYATIDKFQKRGGAMMVIHQGLVHRKHGDKWADRIGFAYSFQKPVISRWERHKETITLDTDSGIFKGFPKTIQYNDELYWFLVKGRQGKITVLGHTRFPKQRKGDKTQSPVFWTVEHGNGIDQARVFACVIAHNDTIHDNAHFRIALLRATAWCLKEPFEPFKPLVFEK